MSALDPRRLETQYQQLGITAQVLPFAGEVFKHYDWADVVIANGVLNLCADKASVFAEIRRVLRPGGTLQFADIANGNPVPAAAMRDIDLWTG